LSVRFDTQLLAPNLRRLRHERKISQEQLAHDAEVDRAYLSRVDGAVTYVGLEIIEKSASILKVDPAEFFRRPYRSGPRRKAD
jgi:transcriptional regulator with XRE-family HTH domain